MAAKSVMTSDASASFFTALPDDLLQRVLVGVPLDDHHAAAAACQAFHGVVNGPRFPALRQKYGFAERGVVTVTVAPGDVLDIQMAHKSGILASVPSSAMTGGSGGTSDGGNRLFVSNITHNATPNQVLTVDVSSRRWRRLAYLPQDRKEHCIEWHRGLLYVAGGWSMTSGMEDLNSLHAFNETTGSWEELPRMPHTCTWAASGVIGNQLFIAGGKGHEEDQEDQYPTLSTLQIYDFTAQTWHLGPPLPKAVQSACGLVVDDKLYVFSSIHRSFQVYDVQSNTWTEQIPPPCDFWSATHAFVHKGRIVVVERSGAAYHRGTGSDPNHWSPFDLDMVAPGMTHGVGGSILFG